MERRVLNSEVKVIDVLPWGVVTLLAMCVATYLYGAVVHNYNAQHILF
jgi:hypothetical protein